MRYSIETLPDGKKYVRADRQVIFGNDPESWSEQVEEYINGKIRNGENISLVAEDGNVVYNIGDIKERRFPTIDGSSAKGGALGGKSSANSISKPGENVNGKFSLSEQGDGERIRGGILSK